MDLNNKTSVTTTFIVRKIVFNNYMIKGSFSFKPNVSVSINKISDNEWDTSINVKVINKEGSPFPFDLDVVVSLITKFNGELPGKAELLDYLRYGSTNILFPYVRSVVTNVSTAAMVAPLIIPLMDIREFADKISIPDLNDDK